MQMTTTAQNAAPRFCALNRSQQLLLLARFGHELTVDARDTYVPQSLEISAPERLRAFNEMQHRLHGYLVALLLDTPNNYPVDVFMSFFFSHENILLNQQTSRAFESAYARTTST